MDEPTRPDILQVRFSLRGGIHKLIEVKDGHGKKIDYFNTDAEEILASGAPEIYPYCGTAYKVIPGHDAACIESIEGACRTMEYKKVEKP